MRRRSPLLPALALPLALVGAGLGALAARAGGGAAPGAWAWVAGPLLALGILAGMSLLGLALVAGVARPRRLRS